MEVAVRPMGAGETSFVVGAWSDSALGATPHRGGLAPGYVPWLCSYLEKLLKACEVRIAAEPDLHGFVERPRLYGCAVLEPDCIHMVYVVKPFRRQGIARRLLASVDIGSRWFSTHTQDVTNWIREKYPGMKYRPFWMEAP